MANPTPEIMPDKAKNAGAAVVGTGRSDFLIRLTMYLLSQVSLEVLWIVEQRKSMKK